MANENDSSMIDQDILDANPILVTLGAVVGDTVSIVKAEVSATTDAADQEEKTAE